MLRLRFRQQLARTLQKNGATRRHLLLGHHHPTQASCSVFFFFDSVLVGQLGFLTPDAQKVVSPSIVFDDLDGVARRISWRVEETTGRVTEYVRLDDESENVLH